MNDYFFSPVGVTLLFLGVLILLACLAKHLAPSCHGWKEKLVVAGDAGLQRKLFMTPISKPSKVSCLGREV